MYSAVLMLALTTGTDAVDHGRNRCGNGCNGYGYACSGAVSYGCSYGGGGHHGGCVASYGGGCFNSYGCSNGCSRGGHHGRCGGGGLFGGRNRCNGCSAYTNCCAPVYSTVCSGGTVIYGGSTVPPKGMPKSEPVPPPKKDDKKPVSAPATIVVNLPAEARLFIDGNATSSTSAVRTLVTPELEVGVTYAYTVRAEIVRDGQVVTQSQQVNVTGGRIANVQFSFPQTVASR